jgi:hypothetical protein
MFTPRVFGRRHRVLKSDTGHSSPMELSVRRYSSGVPSRSESFQATTPSLRLVSAILVEIDEKWASDTKPTSNGNARMRDPLLAEFPDNRLLNLERHQVSTPGDR